MGKSRKYSTSKADMKFEKKLQFYAKVRDSVVALNAEKTIAKTKKTHSRRKKLKAYDLSALSEFLPELEAPQKPTQEAEIKLNCKSRKNLILREGKQLSKVLNHPAFKSDPLEAIHQHLQSTQPVLDEQPKKKTNKNSAKKVKRKKSNAGTESMEF